MDARQALALKRRRTLVIELRRFAIPLKVPAQRLDNSRAQSVKMSEKQLPLRIHLNLLFLYVGSFSGEF